MGPLDAIWHLMNFFAPAAGVAVVSTVLAKLLWRRQLAGAGMARLVVWSAGAGATALLAGLVVFGRDGRMGTYGLLVAATAVALWWAGFMRR